ncbi:hypothetical protein [Labilithrix luteola]|nr:hypothetical protein [Labilithrix luteola]
MNRLGVVFFMLVGAAAVEACANDESSEGGDSSAEEALRRHRDAGTPGQDAGTPPSDASTPPSDAGGPAQGAPALGAHTLLWQGEGTGFSPAVSTPLTTQATGSSFLVLKAGYASNSNAPTDNKSNTWVQRGNAVYYNGYGDAFNALAYVSLVGNGGSNHTVSVVKNGSAKGEITVPFIEIKNAGILKDVAQNYPANGPVITSGNVTTTGPATLIAVWFGDGGVKHMTAVPNNGFTVIDSLLDLPDSSAVQAAVASKNVTAAGTYNVSWTESPNQGAILWLFAFQSQP